MGNVKVSIVILRYKEIGEVINCLNSIKKVNPRLSFEVILVDNNKKKRIINKVRGKYSWLRYVKSPGNIGFDRGNNLGAKYAKGEYLLFLNPDTLVLPKAIDKLSGFLDKNHKTGVVAPNLIDEKGKVFLQLGSRALTPIRGIVAHSFINKIFPNNPISRSYWLKDIPMDKLREVDVVPGSALMIRRNVFERIGGFDENFFIYFEESDLCKRVKEEGCRIFIIPQARIVHYWEPKTKNRRLNKEFEKSRLYYFKKHYGIFWALVVEAFARFSKEHAIFLGFLLLYILFALIILQL